MWAAGFIVLIVVAVLLARAGDGTYERNLRLWKEVALELGLKFEGGPLERTIDGEIQGVSVRASYRRQVGATERNEHALEQVTFRGAENGCIPGSLTVRKDDATRLLGLRFGGRDVLLGDAAFDELVELSDLDASSCAALSHPARQQLARFLKLGGEVRQGVLCYVIDGSADHERDSLVAVLQFLAQLGQALSVTSDTLHQRLSSNALRDPNAGVRWRNLRFLADPTTQTPAALLASTARSLLTDETSAVRILAARQLAQEGIPVLRAELTSPQTDVPGQIAALRALADLHATDLEPLLIGLLAAPNRPELVCAALSVVAQQRLNALRSQVARWTEAESEDVRRAAATTLGKLAGTEAVLLELLGDTSSVVQQAAVEALAEAGSVRGVEPLLPLARSLMPGPLRNAARATVAQIQARLGSVEAGRVSLADQQELLVGAVDLADVSGAVRVGELSLSDDVNESDERTTQLRATRTSESDSS